MYFFKIFRRPFLIQRRLAIKSAVSYLAKIDETVLVHQSSVVDVLGLNKSCLYSTTYTDLVSIASISAKRSRGSTVGLPSLWLSELFSGFMICNVPILGAAAAINCPIRQTVWFVYFHRSLI